jgi:hypothetical protein
MGQVPMSHPYKYGHNVPHLELHARTGFINPRRSHCGVKTWKGFLNVTMIRLEQSWHGFQQRPSPIGRFLAILRIAGHAL